MTDRPLISRLPLADDPPTDPLVQVCYERSYKRGREPLNLHKALSHAPDMLSAINDLTNTIRFKSSLPRETQELIIVKVSGMVQGDYVYARHKPLAMGWGVSREKLAAVPQHKNSTLFNVKEKALLSFVEALTKPGAVDDATFAELAKHYTNKEIIEITVSAAGYLAVSRAGTAMGLKVDQGHDPEVPSKHQ
jgi:alkylhydroperoxidase family enzyme